MLDGTYISVHDTANTSPKASSHTRINDHIGELVALAMNGNYILAGGGGESGGAGGTAVFEINPTDLAINKVVNSDGLTTHWMKDNGTYVIESKRVGAVVKIWK